jgi:tRNA threonylcarbamoyladenosine biosynthesis protein TsaB
MTEALILYIETATDICSVAISKGEKCLSLVESGPERSHATLLSRFIREASEQAGISLQDLDGIAVSRGPGSYTGLRIGVSTAKGLAYALEKPLLSCGTLEHMAHGALGHPGILKLLSRHGKKLLLCPMLDARRMEVYAAFYSGTLEEVRKVSADLIDRESYSDLLKEYHVCFFGNGSVKCREVLTGTKVHFVGDLYPSDRAMAGPVLQRFGQGQFEDLAYFEPFYL